MYVSLVLAKYCRDLWMESGMVYFEEYLITNYLMLIIYVNELTQY